MHGTGYHHSRTRPCVEGEAAGLLSFPDVIESCTLWLMGFFSTLFGSGGNSDRRFQSEAAYAENRARHLAMTPQTVAQLRKFGVTDESQLKLEYFFYTNTKGKAAALAQKLADMGYAGSHDHSASDEKQFVVNGWTSPMRMDEKTVLDWTGRMCDLGHEHDCEFDGWGTNPKQ